MSPEPYGRHLHKASVMVRHLGRAVRGSRAFYVFRDRSHPSQPHVIACHPPLTDDALLRCLESNHVVRQPVSDEPSHQAYVGLATSGEFDNAELAQEMTVVAAQSLADDIRQSGTFDAATGLPDRATFIAVVSRQLAAPAHGDTAIAVVDLDHFHRVIARFGEAGGEELMQRVAERLGAVVGDSASVARLGGDRFGFLMPAQRHDVCEPRALAVAARAHDALRASIRVADEEIFITASIGVAFGGRDTTTGTLLHEADLAIAMAKSCGGAATRVFRAGMANRPAFQLMRERDVRLAVTRDEFTVHFQPIVSAGGSELHAYEALLRWRNPEEGLLPPATFLDVLHETGLIDDVGRKVIEESCAHAARWLALSGTLVPVSVNIAPVQLYADDFADHIAHTLADTGLPAEGLILELTENALIEDAARVRVTLEALRDLGVRVLIDDFGTGYSSLSYLHELPVNGIKLDRRWFRSIETSAMQREIVRAIVGLAHLMQMQVVAEGIENPAQLSAARDLQCDFAQGFCFARPFDAEQATRYLAQHLTTQIAVA